VCRRTHQGVILILVRKGRLPLNYLVEEGEVINETLARGEGLDTASESGDHSKTSVLNLGLPKAHSLLWRFCSESERVEGSTRVQSFVEIGLSVTVDLGTSNKEDLKKSKLGDGEWKVEVEVASAIKLNLTSLVPEKRNARNEERWPVGKKMSSLPRDTSGKLSNNRTKSGKHSPTAVDQLAFTESAEAEDIRVRRKLVLGVHFINVLLVLANHPSGSVDSLVLIELVNLELEVFSRLGESKRIESTVSWKGTIEPSWTLCVWEPKRIIGLARWRRCSPLSTVDERVTHDGSRGLVHPSAGEASTKASVSEHNHSAKNCAKANSAAEADLSDEILVHLA